MLPASFIQAATSRTGRLLGLALTTIFLFLFLHTRSSPFVPGFESANKEDSPTSPTQPAPGHLPQKSQHNQPPQHDGHVHHAAHGETEKVSVVIGDAIHGSDRQEESDMVDWSRFAYVQYATDPIYLCNSLMLFDSLHRSNSKPARVLMHDRSWRLPSSLSSDSQRHLTPQARLLLKARDEYNVTLVPVKVHTNYDADDRTWQSSFTKLMLFNLTGYDRVLSLDSDGLLQGHVDELFTETQEARVGMPEAYWLNIPGLPSAEKENHQNEDDEILSNDQTETGVKKERTWSSQVLLVTPSQLEMERIETAILSVESDEYDMEIVNKLYAQDESAWDERDEEGVRRFIPLEHKRYDLLSRLLREEDGRGRYLGGLAGTGTAMAGEGADSVDEKWDPRRVYAEAKYIHFSEWPLPKPWYNTPVKKKEEFQPACTKMEDGSGEEDCSDREVWNGLFESFRDLRETVCGKRLESPQRFRPGLGMLE